MKNIIASLGLMILISAIPSCEQPQISIEPADLDFEKPFGFNWQSVDGLEQLLEENNLERCRLMAERPDSPFAVSEPESIEECGLNSPRDRCRKLIARLGVLVAPDVRDYFVEVCAVTKYDVIFLPVNDCRRSCKMARSAWSSGAHWNLFRMNTHFFTECFPMMTEKTKGDEITTLQRFARR